MNEREVESVNCVDRCFGSNDSTDSTNHLICNFMTEVVKEGSFEVDTNQRGAWRMGRRRRHQ